MKRRHTFILILLSISTTPLLSARENSLGANGALTEKITREHPDFELRSLTRLGSSYLFSIHHKPTGKARWASSGDQIEGLSILEYEELTKSLQVKAGDKNYVLWLQGRSIGPDTTALTPADLTANLLEESRVSSPRLAVSPRGASRQIERTFASEKNEATESPPYGFASSVFNNQVPVAEGGSPPLSFSELEQYPESRHGWRTYRVAPRDIVDSDILY